MKYKIALLLLLVWAIRPLSAQEKAADEKPKPPKAEETAAPPEKADEDKIKLPKSRGTSSAKEKAEEDKPKPSRVRGTPREPMTKAKSQTGPGKARAVEAKPDAITERMPAPVKVERQIIVTDQRDRKIQLSDFHLGSAGVWEYEGLRIRKQEDVSPLKKRKPEPVGKVRTRILQDGLRDRLSRKRTTNREEPDPKPVSITNDTVVKWDKIKEADIRRDTKDKSLYARVITTDNKLIKGPVNIPSDYLIGTMPNGKDYVIRLKNVKHIAFSANPGDAAKRPAPVNPKPHAASVKRGDKETKRMQAKPPTSG